MTGVEVIGGEVETIEAGEIVLCSGALATPLIMILSGLGPAGVLGRLGIETQVDLPGVGENLKDHAVAGVELAAADPALLASNTSRTQTLLVYTASGSPDRNDMRISPNLEIASKSGPGALRLTCTVELPSARGRLEVLSADPRLGPRVDFGHLSEAWDRDRMREAVRLPVQLAEQPTWAGATSGRIAPSDDDLRSDAALDAWTLRTIGSASHSVGTWRMGSDRDELAVVDDRCRVRGVEGLRIVDLSIVPHVRANPMATAVMVGERGAELIS